MKNNQLVWVELKQKNIYQIINKFKETNVNIYQIKEEQARIIFLIKYADFLKIKKYYPNYEFKCIKVNGMAYFKKTIKKYYLYFIACLIGITIFYLANHLIVDIEIVHENSEIRQIVYNALKEHNVKILSFKKKHQELEQIRQEILDEYPDKLDWLEIEEHGMKYVVKVEERIINNKNDEQSYCNIYAEEDGIVSEIKVKKGVPLVKLGASVKKGDILISGDIVYNEELKSQVCAEGEVYSQKWYTVSISIPLKYYDSIPTKKVKYNFIWETDDNKIQLLKPRLENYEREEKELFNLFNRKLLLEKEIEIQKKEKKYSEDEAINRAMELAQDNINLKLKTKESIIDENVLKKSLNDSTMDIEIFIATKEIISN